MALMPMAIHSVRIPGGEVEYYALGQGPPLVLLHGLGGSAEVWYRVAPDLAKHFTVFALRLWGQGLPPNRGRYTVEYGVGLVRAFLDAVECDAAHLCGSSLGGLLAGFTALRHPDRVRTVTIASGAGLGREAAFFLRGMTLPAVGELLFRPSRKRICRLVDLLVADHSTVDDELIETLYRDRLRPGVPGQMLRVLRSGIDIRGTKQDVLLTPYLEQISVSALVLWGGRDPLFPVRQGKAAAEKLPRGEFYLFPDAGHWPYVERHQTFMEVLGRFLLRWEGQGT